MFRHIIFISCCLFVVLTFIEAQDNKYKDDYYERIDTCKETCSIDKTWEIFDPELLANLETEFETTKDIEEKMQIATCILTIFYARLPLIVQVNWEDYKITSLLVDQEEMDKIYEILTSDLWFFQGLWETTTYTNKVNQLIREGKLEQAEWNAKKALKSVNKPFRLKEAKLALAYLYRTLYYRWEKEVNVLEQDLENRETLNKSQEENIAPEISTTELDQGNDILETTTKQINEETNIPKDGQEDDIFEEQEINLIPLENEEIEQGEVAKEIEEINNEIDTLKQEPETQEEKESTNEFEMLKELAEKNDLLEEPEEENIIPERSSKPIVKEQTEKQETTENIDEETNISEKKKTHGKTITENGNLPADDEMEWWLGY